jgi:uncharacterized protein
MKAARGASGFYFCLQTNITFFHSYLHGRTISSVAEGRQLPGFGDGLQQGVTIVGGIIFRVGMNYQGSLEREFIFKLSGTIELKGAPMTIKIKAKNKLSPKLAKIADEVTRRILETVQPQRVLLFGSSVHGKFTKDSDLDVLVIVRGPVHRRELAQKINRNLHGIEMPVDIVVATEEDVAQYGDKFGTILRPALMEGRVLYAR